jgi:hypothetical protein
VYEYLLKVDSWLAYFSNLLCSYLCFLQASESDFLLGNIDLTYSPSRFFCNMSLGLNTMTDESEVIPPPYTSHDSLRSSAFQRPGGVQRTDAPGLNVGSLGIPSYEYAVGEDIASQFTSAIQYFEEHPGPNLRPGNRTVRHTLSLNARSSAANIAFIPLCWQNARANVTQDDMFTFANYLFQPSTLQSSIRDKLQDKLDRETESLLERKQRFEVVNAEWNEGFFRARGLYFDLIFHDSDEAHHSSNDISCPECAAAIQDSQGKPSMRVSVSQLRPVTSQPNAQNLVNPAWLPMPRSKCGFGLVASLVAQASAHHAERRAIPRYARSCDSRQNQGCGSRRRRCGQWHITPVFPTTTCPSKVDQQEGYSAPLPLVRSSAHQPPVTSLDRTDLKDNELPTLPQLMADMNLNTAEKKPFTGALPDSSFSHALLRMSLSDFQAHLNSLQAPHTNAHDSSSHCALQSDLKALKQQVKTAIRQVKAQRLDEARASGQRCSGGGGMSWVEKRQLKAWRRERMGEIRAAQREVRWRGRRGARYA